jgi:hypothetical protein
MQSDFTAIIEREGDGYVALYALSLIFASQGKTFAQYNL